MPVLRHHKAKSQVGVNLSTLYSLTSLLISVLFRLILRHRGNVLLQKSSAADLRSSAAQCLPVDVVSNLVNMKMEVEAEKEDERISAELLIPRRGCLTADMFR